MRIATKKFILTSFLLNIQNKRLLVSIIRYKSPIFCGPKVVSTLIAQKFKQRRIFFVLVRVQCLEMSQKNFWAIKVQLHSVTRLVKAKRKIYERHVETVSLSVAWILITTLWLIAQKNTSTISLVLRFAIYKVISTSHLFRLKLSKSHIPETVIHLLWHSR